MADTSRIRAYHFARRDTSRAASIEAARSATMSPMKLLKDFETFAIRGNAIDLAVGVVIGAAFNQITTAFSNGILTPPVMLLLGRGSFAGLSIPIGGGAFLAIGALLEAALNFALVTIALFILVKLFTRLARKRKEEEKKPDENPELKVLMEIREELRNRRP